jgi:hypothetical protein
VKVVIGQRHEESPATWPAPSIALNAANQPFAIVIDFNQGALAQATVAEVVHLLGYM